MKKLMYTVLFLLFVSIASGQAKNDKLIASTCGGRGCSGSAYCSACKNCTGCKHCAKEGGSCGVCAPPTKKQTATKKPKATKTAKSTKSAKKSKTVKKV